MNVFGFLIVLLLFVQKIQGSLIKNLFSEYDNQFRPVKENKTLEVTLDLQLNQLLKMV